MWTLEDQTVVSSFILNFVATSADIDGDTLRLDEDELYDEAAATDESLDAHYITGGFLELFEGDMDELIEMISDGDWV